MVANYFQSEPTHSVYKYEYEQREWRRLSKQFQRKIEIC